MARTVNVAEHTTRRDEILDAAQQLILSIGYERLTVQDILNLQISKGAFYQYFDSKPTVIEALTTRLISDSEQALAPIVEMPGTAPVQKLQAFFDEDHPVEVTVAEPLCGAAVGLVWPRQCRLSAAERDRPSRCRRGSVHNRLSRAGRGNHLRHHSVAAKKRWPSGCLSSGIAGVTAQAADGPIEIRADLTVACDGRWSVIRDRSGLPVTEYPMPIEVLWFRLPRTDFAAETLGYVGEGQIVIAINRGEYWQCGTTIDNGGLERI
ncbi:hypothetical protein MHAE_05022 [Mycobacterium haemophilum DSM 44634]|uniref:TetR/AcrR family transcriptional regulator n=1 Tax=Mycobacterium haemophilum TaxID=29311 RepID=UPI0009E6A213|nr:TetR/AcrR family transcriptional regulator [Mycobacterium haemophilum]MCV7339965.1 TetR family transcriptional regulator [Mycobacterium haemophilum DSM 44634]